jgi:predicted ATPase
VPRHQTLRALIDWSHALLSEAERVLLRRLSVFAGGWTLTAAEAVCGGTAVGCQLSAASDGEPGPTDGRRPRADSSYDVLELLTLLADKSLVQCEAREPGTREAGGARYRLLETVRQYSRERLAEAAEVDAVRGRHRDYFLALCEQAAPQLEGGSQQVAWVQRLEREHDNLRAALSSAVDSDADVALQMVGALWWFWFGQSSYSEGHQWIEAALARGANAAPMLRARAHSGGAFLGAYTNDMARADELAEEGLALARESRDKQSIVRSLYVVGSMAVERGAYERAGRSLEEGLALAREVEDQWAATLILQNLGQVRIAQGAHEQAGGLLEEALALARDAEDGATSAWALYYLAGLALLRSDPTAAGRFVAESLALSRQTGQKLAMTHATEMLGRVRLAEGDTATARTLFVQSLTTHLQTGDEGCLGHFLEAFACLALAQGLPCRSTRLLGASDGVATRVQIVTRPIERALSERTLAATSTVLDEEQFAAAWAEGQAMPLEAAIAFALETADPP